jgi:hypothetical protein
MELWWTLILKNWTNEVLFFPGNSQRERPPVREEHKRSNPCLEGLPIIPSHSFFNAWM